MCNIPKHSPNILTQFLWDASGMDAFSPLPRYATRLIEQLTQTLNYIGPPGHIYQGLVKFKANKYMGGGG